MAGLSGEGIAVSLPAGWDGRIFRREAVAPETTHAVAHLANFGLPTGLGDYGDGAVQRMGPGNVFIALVEFHPDAAATALFSSRGAPWPLAAQQFAKSSLQRPIAGQGGVQRFFSEAGRAWCVYVVVGSFDARARLTGVANSVLTSVAISPHQAAS